MRGESNPNSRLALPSLPRADCISPWNQYLAKMSLIKRLFNHKRFRLFIPCEFPMTAMPIKVLRRVCPSFPLLQTPSPILRVSSAPASHFAALNLTWASFQDAYRDAELSYCGS